MAEFLKHPRAPDVDLNEIELTDDNAKWILEQAQQRVQAQTQLYIAIQSRAVTFAGIVSALSVGTIGGLAALYLRMLGDRATEWYEGYPFLVAGTVLAITLFVAMIFSISASFPAKFFASGHDPYELINPLDYHSKRSRGRIPILWHALDYRESILENDKNIRRKSYFLWASELIVISAFPLSIAFLTVLLLHHR